MPLFSVIIPNYNHAAWLRQRIDSVLAQDYPDFEIILLDDHSTDGSATIIEEYRHHPKITHIIFNEKNLGRPVLQWQKGINVAGGTWIWIAESDDFSDPEFLSACKSFIDKHPSTGLWYCDSYIYDENSKKVTRRSSERKNGMFKTDKWSSPYCQEGIKEINDYLKKDCTVNNMSAAVFRKDIIAPLLDDIPHFQYYADWWLCLKTCLQADICYDPKPLNTYRRHSQSLTTGETSIIQTKQEYFEILKLLYHQGNVTDKKHLVNHFAYNYLSYSFFKDGMGKGSGLLKRYFAADRKLAAIVFNGIVGSRIFPGFYEKNYGMKDPGETSINP
jgi:glycosyltransferase involved in cell wall biosynthesis